MSEKKSETIQLPVNYSGKIDNSDQKPSVRTYILESDEKLPMVIVCPGGGYEHLSERESEPVAKKMNALGFHSMVLSYSLAPMEFPAAMCDLAEAVVLARKHSDDWNVDAGRIIVCGFSAGFARMLLEFRHPAGPSSVLAGGDPPELSGPLLSGRDFRHKFLP